MVMNTTNATKIKFTGFTIKANDVSAEEVMKSIDIKNFYKIITVNGIHTVLYFKEVHPLENLPVLPVLDENSRLSFVFNKELKPKKIKEEKRYQNQNQLLWHAKENVLSLYEVFGSNILRTIVELPCNHQNVPVCFTSTHRVLELLPKLVKAFDETVQALFEDGNLVIRFSKFNACYTFPIQHCKRHDFITAEDKTKPDIGEITSVSSVTEPDNLRLNLYGSHCLNEKVANRKDKVLIGIKGNIYVTDVNMVTIDNGKVMANKSKKIKTIGTYGQQTVENGVLIANSELPTFVAKTNVLKKSSAFIQRNQILTIDIDIKNNSAIISNENTNLQISCNATYLK